MTAFDQLDDLYKQEVKELREEISEYQKLIKGFVNSIESDIDISNQFNNDDNLTQGIKYAYKKAKDLGF